MANQPKQTPGLHPQKGDSLYDAQARRTKAQASQEELKLKKIEGELVPRAAVEKAQVAAYRRVRDGVQNVASRIAGLVAAESDQAKCFAILVRELNQVLEQLAKSKGRLKV